MKLFNAAKFATLTALSIALLYGCGGSSGSSGSGTSTISGSAFASYIEGAQITVKDTSGNIVAGPVMTGADGSYSIDIPAGARNDDLIFESYSGTYTDEVFGVSVKAETFCAYVAGGTLSSASSVHATPASTIICKLVREHSRTLTQARNAFASAFGYTPDVSIKPVDATFANATTFTVAQQREGLRAASFSQLLFDLNGGTLLQTHMPALIAALAQDLSDDTLDGKDSSGIVAIGSTGYDLPEDIKNRFGMALLDFKDSGKNTTNLEADKIGTLPFATVALTNSYRIEYIQVGMMGAMEGKSTFKLNITNISNGTAATGLTPTLMPMMHMSTMSHGTPVEGCTETADGEYTCTLYYAMASAMGDMFMGYWELKVMADMSNTAYFYPPVMMRMDGDTNKAKLKGQTDMVMGMMMPEQRTYYIYNDGATEAMMSSHDVKLFIAAKESMMSFPPVSAGTVLNSGDETYELTVSTMTVEVSTDGSSWVSATDNGTGHWTAEQVGGMTTGEAGTLYVKITINGEQKTTDGNTPAGDGSNEYTMLTITPGSGMGNM